MADVLIEVDALPEILRSHGLRVAAPRLAVYRAVAQAGDHPDAEEIACRARALIGTLTTQAVYDVLHVLTSVGLLRRIEPAGGVCRRSVSAEN
jgi:Fur family ferric uptake transcriptional regulator